MYMEYSEGWLKRFQEMPLPAVLSRLEISYRHDTSLASSGFAKRLHADVKGRIVELDYKNEQWFDRTASKGGSGGIELAMHLFKLSFSCAVKRLKESEYELEGG